MGRFRKLSTWGAVTGGLVVLAFTTGAGKPQGDRAFGFMLTSMTVDFYRGDEKIDCPEGRSHTVREAFLATQTAAERERLLKPENSVELERKYKGPYVTDSDGRDICTDSAVFDTPDRETQKLVQSKIGPGLDLDGVPEGKATPATCPHQNFVSPTGEAGVDNQFFRVVACNTAWRGASSGVGDFAGENWPENPTVVIVRDVQSWENDPHVEVLIGASPERPALDAAGKVADGASLTLTDNPRYRNLMTGRIENGVLLTDPADLVLPYNWVGASGGEYIVKRIRIRVKLTPDGDLKGQAGGYRGIDNILAVPHVGGSGVGSVAGLECASVRKTLRLMADGDRDARTGQCTTVSMGLTFGARPAFVFDKGVLVASPGGGAMRQAMR